MKKTELNKKTSVLTPLQGGCGGMCGSRGVDTSGAVNS